MIGPSPCQFVLFFNFSKVDENGDGVIDIDEFVDALLPMEASAVFREFDPRGKGVVGADKLPEMLAEFSMNAAKRPDFTTVLAKSMVDEGFDGSVSTPRQQRHTLGRSHAHTMLTSLKCRARSLL